MSLTLQERCDAFARAFPNPACHLRIVQEQGRDVAYGRWLLGQNYRAKTTYYGAYPPHFLERLMALFPDAASRTKGRMSRILHAFSGSLPPGDYWRCDKKQPADLSYDVCDLPQVVSTLRGFFDLVIADPPYSKADAEKYGTPMIDAKKVTAALAQVVKPGGHLCWLDTCWPMHRKSEWLTVARIAITRSTNHRVRDLTIFQRVSA